MIDLEQYCDEDFINIPKDQWSCVLKEIQKTPALKEYYSDKLATLSEKYPPPVPSFNEDEMILDYERFERYKCDIIKTDSYLRAGPYKYQITDSTLKFFRWGSIVADAFTYETMLEAGHRRYHRNIFELWESHSGRKTAFNSIIALKKPKIDKKMVLTGVKMRLHIVSNYKPLVAREIYNMFGNQGTVLDLCAGYGGRIVGFWGSNCQNYIGIDPNTKLQTPYNKLKLWLNKNFPKDKNIQTFCSPAEDFDYSFLKNSVDLIFTSPPYFNLERYSKEETQSWIRYKNISEWKNEFLHKTLSKSYETLKKGGYIIINICDSESHPDLRVCDDMLDFLVCNLGMKYIPGIKMLLSNRPGNKIKPGTLKVAEPIWIVQKN